MTRPYHEWYYNTEVWKTTTYMGIVCMKSVSDMWNYQEILCRLKPSLVVEFGTLYGGATLFFSNLLKMLNTHSKVFTVDIKLGKRLIHTLSKQGNIQGMRCSSTDTAVAKEIRKLRIEYPGAVFFILDSAHSKKHVLAEMEMLRRLTRPGDYLIVEDSNINGHPVLPGFGEGPMEAINEYFAKYPYDYEHDRASENKFGFTFAPEGFLIRK